MTKAGKMKTTAPATAATSNRDQAAAPQMVLSEEDRSKDAFFVQTAGVAEAMIAAHGRDFAIGTLVLAAKFIAEGKPLIKRAGQ
jgi:hypothetical protein